MPKISLILPIYQVEKYIGNSITSICNQTFKDFEVILVNDGTKDNSIEIAKKILLTRDISFHLVQQTDSSGEVINNGVSYARNLGIRNASGEWVICIDPDDCIHPRMLEIYDDAITHTKSDSYFCDFYNVLNTTVNKYDDITAQNKYISINQKEISALFFYRDLVILSPVLMLKKQFIIDNNLFYDEACRYSEDIHYIWRLIEVCMSIVHIELQLYNYLHRPNSTMTSSSIEKIMTGYSAMRQLDQEMTYSTSKFGINKNYILPRWVLGVCHSGAKMLNYDDFLSLLDKINVKKYVIKLFPITNYKIYIAARILYYTPKIFYTILRGNI